MTIWIDLSVDPRMMSAECQSMIICRLLTDNDHGPTCNFFHDSRKHLVNYEYLKQSPDITICYLVLSGDI